MLAQASFHRVVFKYRNVLQNSPHLREQQTVSLLCAVKVLGWLVGFSFFCCFLSPFSGFSVLDGVQLGLALEPPADFGVRAEWGGERGRAEDGAGEILQGFISFPPARCCPVKARSQPAAQDPVPKRSSASRNGAWVPTRGRGGWQNGFPAAFPGTAGGVRM